MKVKLRGVLLVGWLLCLPSQAGAQDPARDAQTGQEMAEFLRKQFESIRCDAQHFIYGVGYVDGSYMERIFYVEWSGDAPEIGVEFRDSPNPDSGSGARSGRQSGPVSFVLELTVPRALYATPEGENWRVSADDWESALRFKYTSWFGEIRGEPGAWEIEWQGYRRPMLPGSVTGHPEAICARFAER